MTHHFILTGSLVLIACAFLRAAISAVAYRRQSAFNRVDRNYRSAALIANAKREVRCA